MSALEEASLVNEKNFITTNDEYYKVLSGYINKYAPEELKNGLIEELNTFFSWYNNAERY